jgi:xanthine dehydrogenase accessory factor
VSFDLTALRDAVERLGPVVRVLVSRTAGSVPRVAGTSMVVSATAQEGTIGGGALEFEAVRIAREVLGVGGMRHVVIPLGPGLGQCCGGSVTLVWERFEAGCLPGAVPYARLLAGAGAMPNKLAARVAAMRAGADPVEVEGWLIEAAPLPRQPLWVWGAGHVGRAIVGVMGPLPQYAITWVDARAEAFPNAMPERVLTVVAAEPAVLARFAPRDAEHLILTHSHETDLAICHALLGHEFAGAGLIGSATKWARFRGRLAALGHSPARISAIACPIGDPALGKHPQAIAVGVTAALLRPKGMTATRGAQTGNGVG